MGFERFANSRGGFIFLNCECTTPNKPFADKYFLDNNLSILLLVYLKHPQDTKKVCESNYLQSCTSVLFKCWRELLLLKAWGTGIRVGVDGTFEDIYDDNMTAEYHVRYGKKGGVAYRHIADNYILNSLRQASL